MNRETILILDGEERSALAATRSLGRKQLRVLVASELESCLAGASRFCSRKFQYESPYSGADRFIKDIKAIIENEKVDVLMPMTDTTLWGVLSQEEDIRSLVRIPFVSFEKYSQASNKMQLMKLAADLHIPTPRTIFVERIGDVDELEPPFGYPFILKPMSSLIKSDDGLLRTSVKIIHNLNQFRTILQTVSAFRHPFMIQEKLEGEGIGVFFLFDKGRLVTMFSHRRIREKPPWGGVSVVSESTVPDPDASMYATRLLEALEWDGIAMVEFKRESITNRPILMEINARFWGSLQLAIDSGVDFPYLLYLQNTGKEVPKVNYAIGRRLRWFFGDLDSLYLALKGRRNQNNRDYIRHAFKSTIDFIREFFKSSNSETFRYDDARPFFCEMATYIRKLGN